MLKKIDGQPDLVKDTTSGGILNTNEVEYIRRQREKARLKNEQAAEIRMETIEADINNLKDDLSEIKNLLRTLINGNTNS